MILLKEVTYLLTRLALSFDYWQW